MDYDSVLNVGPMGIDRPWPQLGGHIITWYKNGEDSQLWRWKGNTIVNKLGYVLDVEGEMNWVIASKPNGEKSQEWMMVGDKIISALNGMALDNNVFLDCDDGPWCTPGINVITWPLKMEGHDSQSWELESI